MGGLAFGAGDTTIEQLIAADSAADVSSAFKETGQKNELRGRQHSRSRGGLIERDQEQLETRAHERVDLLVFPEDRTSVSPEYATRERDGEFVEPGRRGHRLDGIGQKRREVEGNVDRQGLFDVEPTRASTVGPDRPEPEKAAQPVESSRPPDEDGKAGDLALALVFPGEFVSTRVLGVTSEDKQRTLPQPSGLRAGQDLESPMLKADLEILGQRASPPDQLSATEFGERREGGIQLLSLESQHGIETRSIRKAKAQSSMAMAAK